MRRLLEQRNPNLINLLQFDREYLEPLAAALAQAKTLRGRTATGLLETKTMQTKTNYLRSLRFAELVAIYFWLDMGIEVGFFPYAESRAIFSQRFSESFFGDEFVEELENHIHLFDPFFEGVLTEVHSSKEPFNRGPRRIPLPPTPCLLAAFRSALITETKVFRVQPAEVLTAVLGFAPALLERFLKRGEPVRIGDELTIDDNALTKGFAVLVGYMERLVGLSARILDEEGLPIEFRPTVERGIRQVTRWRINRTAKHTDPSLFAIGEYECKKADLDWATMAPRLQTLLDSWGYTQQSRSAVANA